MNVILSSEVGRLEKAFDSIVQDKPFLKPAIDAFKGVIISRAVLKAKLSGLTDNGITLPEQSRFVKGEPWLTRRMIVSLMDPWGDTIEAALLPLVEAVPGI